MNLSLSAARSSDRELNSPRDEGRALPIAPVGAPVARDLRNICFGNRARAPSFNFHLSLSLSLFGSVSPRGKPVRKVLNTVIVPLRPRHARDYLSRIQRTEFHKVPDASLRVPRCFNPQQSRTCPDRMQFSRRNQQVNGL